MDNGHDYSTLLTLYEVYIDSKGELIRPVVQGIYSIEREQKLIQRACQKTMDAISVGNNLYRQEVYKHPIRARKPYLEKYKVSIY